MALNKKNIVSTIILGGLFIPFITLTDFFPFLRFGMFAEPIQTNVQTEQFHVFTLNRQNEKKPIDLSTLGISENTFLYLCRNYYYRKETTDFFKKLEPSMDSSIVKLMLYQTIAKSSSSIADTNAIITYTRYGIY